MIVKGLSHSEKTKMQISEKSKEYIKNNTEEFYKRYRKKEKFILNPLGEVVNFFNVGDLCNENNLSKSMVRRVMQGAYHSHKGWTKFNN